MTSTDTIYALSTGIGRAGVAVFRTSGPQARDGVAVLAASVPPPRQASLRRIRDPASGEIIDEGLVLWFPGPGSFTGEDMAEFHLHGSRAVADGMVGVLGRLPGHRLAEPGEFTRRALANGRTDLVAVEGLSDLLMATSAAQRRQALFHMEGDASRVFAGWRGDLVGCLARVEAAIDFAEEDQVGALGLAEVAEALDRLAGSLAGALAAAAAGESLREGFRVVIAGPPNVGKSSLINRLAGREAAIVTDIPGTTRDPIDVALELDGLALVVTDTAGLRPGTADPIERIGMDRTLARSRAADLVIWLQAHDVDERGDPPIDFGAVMGVEQGRCQAAAAFGAAGRDRDLGSDGRGGRPAARPGARAPGGTDRRGAGADHAGTASQCRVALPGRNRRSGPAAGHGPARAGGRAFARCRPGHGAAVGAGRQRGCAGRGVPGVLHRQMSRAIPRVFHVKHWR